MKGRMAVLVLHFGRDLPVQKGTALSTWEGVHSPRVPLQKTSRMLKAKLIGLSLAGSKWD